MLKGVAHQYFYAELGVDKYLKYYYGYFNATNVLGMLKSAS